MVYLKQDLSQVRRAKATEELSTDKAEYVLLELMPRCGTGDQMKAVEEFIKCARRPNQSGWIELSANVHKRLQGEEGREVTSHG